MKTVFVISICILFISRGNYARENNCLYFPLQSGISWKYFSNEYPDSLVSVVIDTAIIKDRLYYQFAPYGPPNSWPRYWLRSETGRIFALNNQDSSEYLLFDFEADAGHSWEIPPDSSSVTGLPVNQCDWGGLIALQSKSDSVTIPDRKFYNIRRFAHNAHPCFDAGILMTWFAKDFGIIRFSQVTEGGVLDWNLVHIPDTLSLSGIYSIAGNPCLTIPCLPGVVSSISVNDTNYFLTKRDNFFPNADFSWGDYLPEPGDSIMVTGIPTIRKDVFNDSYVTLEVIDVNKIVPNSKRVTHSQVPKTADMIGQNYPNPFNPHTRIQYFVGKPGPVSIILYDVSGKKIRTLVEEFRHAGTYQVELNSEGLPSGTYYYQYFANSKVQTKSMIIIK